MIRRPDTTPAAPAESSEKASRPRSSPGPWKWLALVCLVALLVGVPTYLYLDGRFEKTYVTKMEDQARESRQAADSAHPAFTAATARFEEGVSFRDRGDHEQAYAAFKAADELFRECDTYDESAESMALQARDYVEQLDPEHPWLVEIDEWLGVAGEARRTGAYQAAYECFDKAKILCDKLYEVRSGQSEARMGLAEADRSHPSYAAAEELMLEGQLLLEKTPLSREDMDRARRLFDEARKLFDDAKPYDETAQRVAEAVRTAADATHPRYAEADALYRQALEARTQAHHGEAYELFEAARDGYLVTCSSYQPFDEIEAERGREVADPESVYFARGTAFMEAAQVAREAGDYETCYAKYRQAREMFARAASFDIALAGEVADAMARADSASELYAQGRSRYESALGHRDAGRFQQANAELRAALREFAAAAEHTYDPRLEERANRAREDAYPEMPVSYSAGEQAMTDARAARESGDLALAYELLRRAQRHYRRARFDPRVRAATALAREQADPSHRDYARAQEREKEAIAAYDSGDGPSAAATFERATLEYAAARARATFDPGTGDRESAGGQPEGDEPSDRDAALARRAAKLARSDAAGRKDVCDSWEREASITRPTLSHYEEGNSLWEAAEASYARADWQAAEQSYRAALAAWLKVSNRSR